MSNYAIVFSQVAFGRYGCFYKSRQSPLAQKDSSTGCKMHIDVSFFEEGKHDRFIYVQKDCACFIKPFKLVRVLRVDRNRNRFGKMLALSKKPNQDFFAKSLKIISWDFMIFSTSSTWCCFMVFYFWSLFFLCKKAYEYHPYFQQKKFYQTIFPYWSDWRRFGILSSSGRDNSWRSVRLFRWDGNSSFRKGRYGWRR